MKVIIETEGMVMNYEPLEKGQEVDVSDTIGQAWIESGRASLATKTKDDGKSKKTPAPQSTAKKEPKEKR